MPPYTAQPVAYGGARHTELARQLGLFDAMLIVQAEQESALVGDDASGHQVVEGDEQIPRQTITGESGWRGISNGLLVCFDLEARLGTPPAINAQPDYRLVDPSAGVLDTVASGHDVDEPRKRLRDHLDAVVIAPAG